MFGSRFGLGSVSVFGFINIGTVRVFVIFGPVLVPVFWFGFGFRIICPGLVRIIHCDKKKHP